MQKPIEHNHRDTYYDVTIRYISMTSQLDVWCHNQIYDVTIRHMTSKSDIWHYNQIYDVTIRYITVVEWCDVFGVEGKSMLLLLGDPLPGKKQENVGCLATRYWGCWIVEPGCCWGWIGEFELLPAVRVEATNGSKAGCYGDAGWQQ